mmetsp:Transcript_53356/g.165405  ORF Transcript_53356/g.165405 Transcript_53356/m.165405 type:complete len:148 (+) Transcript_53356:20-463(+)
MADLTPLEVRLRARRAPDEGLLGLRLEVLGEVVTIESRTDTRTMTFYPGAKSLPTDLPHSAFVSVKGTVRMPLQPDASGAVELSIFVDRYSLEIFDSVGGTSMATCLSPPCGRQLWNQTAAVTAVNGSALIERFQAFELASTLPNSG